MKKLMITFSLLILSACSSHKPIKTVEHVEIDRFMGKWYVIANIPTFIEKGAHNAVEIYKRNDDGSIATTFRFNKDSFEGEQVEYHPVAYITDTQSNAIWEMQFLWPLKTDYRILHIDEDYSTTVIGRIKRDYVWLMAREPEIPTSKFDEMLDIIQKQGYDTRYIKRVPHKKQDKEFAWRT